MSNWALVVLVIIIVGLHTVFVWSWIARIERRMDDIEKQRGIDQSDPKMGNTGREGMWKP